MQCLPGLLRLLDFNPGKIEVLLITVMVFKPHVHGKDDHLEILDLVLLGIDMATCLIVKHQGRQLWAESRAHKRR